MRSEVRRPNQEFEGLPHLAHNLKSLQTEVRFLEFADLESFQQEKLGSTLISRGLE